MKTVVGVGQCSLDFIASVKNYPLEDMKQEALDLTIQGGGPVATALVSLSRLRVRTVFLGQVSDDWAGLDIIKGLKEEGVDTSSVKIEKGGASQQAFIIANRKTSSRTILWMRPTAPPLSPVEVTPGVIKKGDILLLDGLMTDASLKAAGIAKKYGIPIMLDAGRVREGMIELAALSDYIVCSEDFAKGISPDIRVALKKLSLLSPRAATITLGKRGSITWADGAVFRQSAFKVKAVDTTGAGDVFHGGYIYGLLEGWDIKKTVEFASAFAALKCLKPGGRSGIPTLSRTLKFIKATSKSRSFSLIAEKTSDF